MARVLRLTKKSVDMIEPITDESYKVRFEGLLAELAKLELHYFELHECTELHDLDDYREKAVVKDGVYAQIQYALSDLIHEYGEEDEYMSCSSILEPNESLEVGYDICKQKKERCNDCYEK